MPEESRKEETAVYLCPVCQTAILARIPSGLKGDFVHADCKSTYELRKTKMPPVSGDPQTR